MKHNSTASGGTHLLAFRTAPSFASYPESRDRSGELADTLAPHALGRRLPIEAAAAAAAVASGSHRRRRPAAGCSAVQRPFVCAAIVVVVVVVVL